VVQRVGKKSKRQEHQEGKWPLPDMKGVQEGIQGKHPNIGGTDEVPQWQGARPETVFWWFKELCSVGFGWSFDIEKYSFRCVLCGR